MNQEAMDQGTQAVTKGAGILDSVKERVNVSGIVEKMQTSQGLLVEVAIYSGIGFLSGFLLKKYSTYVLILVLVLIGLGVLNHVELIKLSIDWAKVSSTLGITLAQPVTADGLLASVWEFAKMNKAISISGIVGFLIGFKVG